MGRKGLIMIEMSNVHILTHRCTDREVRKQKLRWRKEKERILIQFLSKEHNKKASLNFHFW